MSDYKAIADRLVERGVLRHYGQEYGFPGDGILRRKPAKLVCHDWRVAGACMEMHGRMWFGRWKDSRWLAVAMNARGDNLGECIDESLPLAIILAYLEATDE